MNEKKFTDQDPFIQHLEKTSEIVRNWPEWKQNVLGRINLPSEQGSKNNSTSNHADTENRQQG